jgi:TetR/AcrR family transcriptional repressor of nem operon
MKKQNTRELLLDSAFNTFYKHGFQGANIANILTDVGINKGSMYHFFKSKKELGLAVITERIEVKILNKYKEVLEEDEALRHLFDTLRSAPETLAYGCPLNKMSQEMLYIDEAFKTLLSQVYLSFENIIEQILQKEKIENSQSKAKLIIATYEGALMIYHLNQNKPEFREVLNQLEKQIF